PSILRNITEDRSHYYPPQGLVGVLGVDHVKDGFEQDRDVEPDRPSSDVIHIVIHPVDELLLAIQRTAMAIDLGPTCDARLHAMAMGVGWHDLVAQLLPSAHVHSMGARPHQRHLA